MNLSNSSGIFKHCIISMKYKLCIHNQSWQMRLLGKKEKEREKEREKETSLRKTQTSPQLTMSPMNTQLVSGLMNLIFDEISYKRAERVNVLPRYRICGIGVLFLAPFSFFDHANFSHTQLFLLSFIQLVFDISKIFSTFLHIITLLCLYFSLIAAAYKYLISNS